MNPTWFRLLIKVIERQIADVVGDKVVDKPLFYVLIAVLSNQVDFDAAKNGKYAFLLKILNKMTIVPILKIFDILLMLNDKNEVQCNRNNNNVLKAVHLKTFPLTCEQKYYDW